MLIVRLTMTAVLASTYGFAGVWTAMAIELTFRGCIFLWHIFFNGKWQKIKESSVLLKE